MQFDADAPVFEPLFTSDGVQTLVNERAPQGKPKYTQRLCKLQINNCDHGFYSGSVDVIIFFSSTRLVLHIAMYAKML